MNLIQNGPTIKILVLLVKPNYVCVWLRWNAYEKINKSFIFDIDKKHKEIGHCIALILPPKYNTTVLESIIQKDPPGYNILQKLDDNQQLNTKISQGFKWVYP